MENPVLARKNALVSGAVVVLTALLAALVVAFVAAKPSEAADPILTVDPTSIYLGSVQVDGDTETRTITVTNTGTNAVVLGSVQLLGADTGAFTTSIGAGGLTVGAGGTATFTVSFDPVKTGLQTADLTFNSITDTLGNAIGGVDAPTVDLTGQGVQANPSGSNCTITGSGRDETLRGTAGRDVICGMGGSDRLNGLGANDVLKGGMHNDRLTDRRGKDRLLGQGGRDLLNARDRSGGDLLKGGGGKDRAIKDKRDRARGI